MHTFKETDLQPQTQTYIQIHKVHYVKWGLSDCSSRKDKNRNLFLWHKCFYRFMFQNLVHYYFINILEIASSHVASQRTESPVWLLSYSIFYLVTLFTLRNGGRWSADLIHTYKHIMSMWISPPQHHPHTVSEACGGCCPGRERLAVCFIIDW